MWRSARPRHALPNKNEEVDPPFPGPFSTTTTMYQHTAIEPTEQKHDDEIVANATRACFALFRSYIATLGGNYRVYLQARFSDLKLWADSVGALADGAASLDRRLRGQSRDVSMVTSLLDMLQQFLEGYESAVKDRAGDADDVKEAKEGIDEITDSLAWIGSAIRRFGTMSRLQKADKFYERDKKKIDQWEHDQLQAHLVCIIKARPTESALSKDYVTNYSSMGLTAIQKRLVEANLRRWHRFRYAQRHAHVLKIAQPVQDIFSAACVGSAPDLTAEPMATITPRINTSIAKQRDTISDRGELRTTAGLSVSAFGSDYQGLQGQHARPAKSEMTQHRTITGLVRLPKAKKSQEHRKTLLCPCCCQALALEEAEDPTLWT